MLKVKCVESSDTALKKDEIYYVFPTEDESYVYISKTPKKSGYLGWYKRSRFIEIKENVLPEKKSFKKMVQCQNSDIRKATKEIKEITKQIPLSKQQKTNPNKSRAKKYIENVFGAKDLTTEQLSLF